MNSFPFESVSGLTLLFIDYSYSVTIWAYTHRSDGDGMLRMFFDNEEVEVRSFSDGQMKTIKDWSQAARDWYEELTNEYDTIVD
jgi:hypothetical protein